MHYSPLVMIHIGGGIAGLISGAVAMVFRKGSRGHVLSGQVFTVSMFCMAGMGAFLAIRKSQLGNVLGGIMTLYMISTAWAAGRRKNGQTGVFDWLALLVAWAAGSVVTVFGFEALYSPTGLYASYPPFVYFLWTVVVLLSAAGDVRMLMRGGVFYGSQRIVRHLWRMCFGLFIASGSFFLGQQKVFPSALRGLRIWFVPAFLPLLLLLFWVARVWWTNTYKNDGTSKPAGGVSGSVTGCVLRGPTLAG